MYLVTYIFFYIYIYIYIYNFHTSRFVFFWIWGMFILFPYVPSSVGVIAYITSRAYGWMVTAFPYIKSNKMVICAESKPNRTEVRRSHYERELRRKRVKVMVLRCFWTSLPTDIKNKTQKSINQYINTHPMFLIYFCCLGGGKSKNNNFISLYIYIYI